MKDYYIGYITSNYSSTFKTSNLVITTKPKLMCPDSRTNGRRQIKFLPFGREMAVSVKPRLQTSDEMQTTDCCLFN